MLRSLYLTGLGGQGTVTLADLLAERAAEAGLQVSIFHAKGMAQRGGRVSSEIRLCDDQGASFGARIGEGGADVLIGMEIGETIDSLPLLRQDGIVLLLDQATVPVELLLKKAHYPSLEEAAAAFTPRTEALFAVREAASPQHVFLLGVFAAVVPPREPELAVYQADALERLIRARLQRNLEQNLAAFHAGYAHGRRLT